MLTANKTAMTHGICLACDPLRNFTVGLAAERRTPERSSNSPNPTFELHSVMVADRAQIVSGLHLVHDLLDSTANLHYLSVAVEKIGFAFQTRFFYV
jgi:hypothetical protein